MRLIKNIKQLSENIQRVENYLIGGTDPEIEFIRDLIGNGKCFVAYQVENELRFAPSRFLGYYKNSRDKHIAGRKEKSVDGKDTNPVITSILKSKLNSSTKMETNYLRYCNDLGISPSAYSKRRYWVFNLSEDFVENKEIEGEFPEGKVVERIHKGRERNKKVIADAKQNFKLKHGRVYCQACKFDFEKVYGKHGKDFIEGHHIIPVCDMKSAHKSKPEEIVLLCANCHRMVHKIRPWLTLVKLKSIVKKNNQNLKTSS
jgi:5-methylcytosine-specific restriction protein A